VNNLTETMVTLLDTTNNTYTLVFLLIDKVKETRGFLNII